MKTNTKLKLLSSATTAIVLLTSAAAFAQTATTKPADATTTTDAKAADEDQTAIVVTGSRIARPELKATIPIVVVSAQAIQDKGQTNLLDALKDIPVSGQSLDRSASNFSNFDTGVATVNLRNLGSSRTLVLINGRRSIGVPGSTAVDLNNIPADLIDHVEIATGGTSAVYGSDAVAGVVNILLKNHFEGLQLHLQNGISSKGDAGSRFASVTAGTAFAGSAGHVVVNASYEDDDALPSSNRSFSKADTPQNSSYAAQGLFDTSGSARFSSAAGQTYTFAPDNSLKLYQGARIDGYTRASKRLLVVPIRRYSGTVLADYEFSSAAKLYVEGSYTKTKARGQIEALAVDDSGNPGQSVQNLDGSPFLGIPVTNPYLPAAIAAAAVANGQNFVNFRRRSVEIFDRSAREERDYYRGVVGLKGDLSAGWNYDLYYEHSQVKAHTTSGAILLNNYGAALQAINLNGQVVCADPAARAAGCVPVNIFGFNTVTPAQVKFLSTYTGIGPQALGATPGQQVSFDFLRKSYQDVAGLNLSGSLFNLPAGPIGVAVGVEYHREKAAENYDPFTVAGISSNQQATNTNGSYHSKEAYAELNIPILKDTPFFNELSIEGAVRYADYSTVGGVWSYKVGGLWAPTHDLRLRAMYARAVRAPNINELFAQQSLTAIQVIDPCDQFNGNGDTPPAGGPRALPTACLSIPGVSNYLKTNQYFSYSLAQVQSAFGYLGGNPNLKAEATSTLTAGGTFQPSFLRGFDLSVDYYNIKVKNAISSVDQQTSVDQCFATNNPQFCSVITRDANGFIKRVDSIALNAASYQVAGLDVQAHYLLHPEIFGPRDKLLFSLFYNHKFKQQQTSFVGGPITNELGTADQYAGGQLGTGFKDQFTFSTNYSTGPFSLAYTLKYMSPVTASSGAFSIPAYTYHDIQAKFSVGEDRRFEFYAGVNNLLDKQPPLITSGNGQFPGTNTVADTYDLFGRMLYVGITAKF